MVTGYIDPIAPMHFFLLHANICYAAKGKTILKNLKYQLPLTTDLLAEEPFVQARAAWNESEFRLHFQVSKPFETCEYPNFQQADAIEVFIDTRNIKDTGFPTRFCHHFLILPQQVQGVRALELSRFRAEDAHELCDPSSIQIDFTPSAKEYLVEVTFPAQVLHGFDPLQFNQLGLNYVVHRPKARSQHFTLSANYVSPAQNPAFWASCMLMK